MRRLVSTMTLGLVLTGWVAASAQMWAPESLDRFFRLEWQVKQARKGPMIEGYVYNFGAQNADHLRLQIDRLDSAGGVVGTSTVWVLGEVPKNNRAYFGASVGDAASYRVQVLSFDWACNGGSGGM
ncbi:MAG: hypothetical protein DME03_04870 [Candidatus Rokuibacteriota bacterium]|nr:MAG: hypothetical protein DME03_04870 [Candidatus Rokubacteria bacterium]